MCNQQKQKLKKKKKKKKDQQFLLLSKNGRRVVYASISSHVLIQSALQPAAINLKLKYLRFRWSCSLPKCRSHVVCFACAEILRVLAKPDLKNDQILDTLSLLCPRCRIGTDLKLKRVFFQQQKQIEKIKKPFSVFFWVSLVGKLIKLVFQFLRLREKSKTNFFGCL